jgi:hypothetical protein
VSVSGRREERPVDTEVDRRQRRHRCCSAAARRPSWGSEADACANRAAVEACVNARNKGSDDVVADATRILRDGTRSCPALGAAIETRAEVTPTGKTARFADDAAPAGAYRQGVPALHPRPGAPS